MSAEAQAKPLTLELVWNAPSGCPDGAHVLAAIHQLMGATEIQGAPTLSVQGDVEMHGAALVLKLGWRTASMQAERIMESSSCDELARAAALVVALAADPGAVRAGAQESDARLLQPQASSASSVQAVPSVRQPQLAAPSEARPASVRNSSFVAYAPDAAPADFGAPPTPPSPAPRSSRVTARAQLALDVGSLPHTAEGAALGVGWGLGLVAIQAEAALYLPQHKSVAEGAAELWLSTLAIRPCLQWSLSRLRVLPCAAAELDLLVGQGEGVDFRQGGAAWFPRFGGGAELGYPLSRQIAWITEGWLLAGPWRPTFVIQDVVPVHQPNLLVGRWTTGLELRL